MFPWCISGILPGYRVHSSYSGDLKAAFGGVKEKKEWKEFFLMIARFLVVMAAGVAVYFLINKAVLAVTHIQLTSYQGGDTMGKITIAQLISALKSCYTSFLIWDFRCYGNQL